MYTIYALKDCEYCRLAVEELRIRGKSFFYFAVNDVNPLNKTLSLSELKDKYNWPTVPIILEATPKGEKLIGGYVDLVDHLEVDNEI